MCVVEIVLLVPRGGGKDDGDRMVTALLLMLSAETKMLHIVTMRFVLAARVLTLMATIVMAG